jgi:hypothetical protein
MKRLFLILISLFFIFSLNYLLFLLLYNYLMAPIHEFNIKMFNAPNNLLLFDIVTSTLPLSYLIVSILSFFIIFLILQLNFFLNYPELKKILKKLSGYLIVIILIYTIISYFEIVNTFKNYHPVVVPDNTRIESKE